MKIFLVVLVAISLFIAACNPAATPPVRTETSNDNAGSVLDPQTPPAPNDDAQSDVNPSAPLPSGIQKISLTVDEYSWTPSEIKVKQGTTIELTITNVGAKAHGLAMPGMNVNVALPPGETKTVTFIADQEGTSRFYCNVPCGSGHGSMTGVLIVE